MQDKTSHPPPNPAEPNPNITQQAPLPPLPYPPGLFYPPPPGQYPLHSQGPYPPYGVAGGYPATQGPGPGFAPPPALPSGAGGSAPNYGYPHLPPANQPQLHSRSGSLVPEEPKPTAEHDVFGVVRVPTNNHPPAQSTPKTDLDSFFDNLTPEELDQFSCDVPPTDVFNSEDEDLASATATSSAAKHARPRVLEGLDFMSSAPASRSQSAIPTGTPKANHPTARRAASQRPAEETDQVQPNFGALSVVPESPQPPQSPDPFSSPPLTPTRKQSVEPELSPTQAAREGRISNANMEVIRGAVLQAERTLRHAADQTGLTMDIITSQYNDITAGGMVLQITPWNYYTSYVHTPPHEECKRLGITYVPGKTKPKGEHFASFKAFKGPNWLEWLMLQYSMKIIKKGTIAELEREHAKFVRRVVALITAAQGRWGFQSLFLTCGTSVNENQSIGTLHRTNYLRNFTEARLQMTPDSLIGHSKTQAYHEVSLEHAQRSADDRRAKAKKAAQDPSSSYIPVDDNITNSGSTIEVIGLPTSTASMAVPTGVPVAPTSSSSRMASTTANVKLEGSPAFPVLTSTVGVSDTELREAAKAIGNPQLNAELEDLLSKNKEEHFNSGCLGADPARTFVKMWMAISFALLGLEFRPPIDSHFDWVGFPNKFAQAGIRLTGWPHGTPFPGENIPGKEKKGIRILLAEPARNVAKAMRFGRIGLTRRTEDIPALLSSQKPIYEEAAPPASETQRARRYFLDESTDHKGLCPVGSRAKSTTRSATARSSKRRGKSRQVETSDDDDNEDDEPAPPPSQYRRSQMTSPSPHASDSSSKGKRTTTPRPRPRQKQRATASPAGWASDDLFASDDPTTPIAAQHINAGPGSAVRIPEKQKAAVKRKAGTAVSSSDEASLGTCVAPEKRPRTELVGSQQPATTSTTTTTTTTSISILVPPTPAGASHQADSKPTLNIGNAVLPVGTSTRGAPPSQAPTRPPSVAQANHPQQAHLPPMSPMPVAAGPMHPGSISTAAGPAAPPTHPGASAPNDASQWPYGPGAPYYQQPFYPPQPPYYGHQAQYFHGGYPQHPPHPAYAFQQQYQQGIPPMAGQGIPPPAPFGGHQAPTNDHQPPNDSNSPPQASGTGA